MSPRAIEALIIRIESRLALAAAAAQELQWGDFAEDNADAASELIRATVAGALSDLKGMRKVTPFPICGYSGEPVREWLVKQIKHFDREGGRV